MDDDVVIHVAGPSDCEALAAFFDAVGADATVSEFFHPHPFTREQAEWICTRDLTVRDLYFVATEGAAGQIAGYAMLRGWDEGYEIPAFGVCVRPDRQGRGLGKLLLEHALEAARAAGASTVMLKVHRDNARARSLYETAGFAFAPGQTTEQVVGYKVLA